MPKGLVRYQQTGDLHFITISCYRHANILGTPTARNILQKILEETRKKYSFQILGYVFSRSTSIYSSPNQGEQFYPRPSR